MQNPAELLAPRHMDSQFQAAPILVVEDEPLIALDIEDSLVALGMPVHVARSLADARGFVARLPLPRLVLLDVVLPDGRSFDFAHELIALGVPLVFLTGYDHGIPDSLRHVTVMEKPFSTDGLIAVVTRTAVLR